VTIVGEHDVLPFVLRRGTRLTDAQVDVVASRLNIALPQLPDGPSTRWSQETADAYRERVELERRELFVGMTRARDGLWLGHVRQSGRRG
jgi:ATP-dependent exoDNAse (exonuclease V) beta subunit